MRKHYQGTDELIRRLSQYADNGELIAQLKRETPGWGDDLTPGDHEGLDRVLTYLREHYAASIALIPYMDAREEE